MTIGIKRIKKLETSLGPGEYSPERAISITKPKSKAVNFEHPVARKPLESSPDLGPGTYNDHIKFGYSPKKMTIGQKREEKTPDKIGPAYYSPNKGYSLTKSKSAAYVFHKNTGRVELQTDQNNGPGTYGVQNEFGSSLGPITIGEKRENKTLTTPGPCDYNANRGDVLIKPRGPSADFKSSPERPI